MSAAMRRALACAAGLLALAAPALGQPERGPAPTPMTGQGRFLMTDGAAIYAHVCQLCHMADARGATGAGTYPSLAANPKLKVAAYPVTLVIRGKGGMPGFGGELDDAQIAAVVTYVRSHFGNDYAGAVTPAQVKALRPPPAAARRGTAG